MKMRTLYIFSIPNKNQKKCLYMRSTAAEETCTPKYFIASVARLAKTV